MISRPNVSVIVPTFNRALYIQQAIESILSQQYTDYEIIVVDDGSTDNTRDVLRQYKNRLTYCYQENKGPGAARNCGVTMAKGQYIAFLDSDDLWLPEKLEIQVAMLEQDRNLAFVCSEAYVVTENGETIRLWKRQNGISATFESLLEDNFITTLTVLMRRSCFNAVGGFDERLSNAQDYDLWLRLAKEGHRFAFIDRPLGKCRFHETNNTKNTDGRVRSYQLLLSKKEIWSSMPFLKRRQRFSGIYYNLAQAYLSAKRYAKAMVNYSKAVFYDPFVGFHFNAGSSRPSGLVRVIRVYYLIFKCWFKALMNRAEKVVI